MSDSLRIWHPFTNELLDPPPIRVTRAEGAYLYTDDGRKIIDAISSWWVNLHGHANPRIARRDRRAGSQTRTRHIAGFTHDAAEELALACANG